MLRIRGGDPQKRGLPNARGYAGGEYGIYRNLSVPDGGYGIRGDPGRRYYRGRLPWICGVYEQQGVLLEFILSMY